MYLFKGKSYPDPTPTRFRERDSKQPCFLFFMVITNDMGDLVDLRGYYADDDDDGVNHDVPHPWPG